MNTVIRSLSTIWRTLTRGGFALPVGLILFNLLALRPLGAMGDILSLFFLLLVPGKLLYDLFFPRETSAVSRVRTFSFSVGLSTLNLLIVGGAANYLFMPFTDAPLSKIPVLILLNIELVVLWLLTRRLRPVATETEDIPTIAAENPALKPRYTWPQKLLLIVAAVLPVMAVLGAIQLNNRGGNYLAVATFVTIFVLVIAAYFVGKQGGRNFLPMVLYSMSLSVLLAGWMRSSFVSGVDVNLEYHIFQITQQLGSWAPSNFPGHAYNACLSITILPTVIGMFVGFHDTYIFKAVMPAVFAVTPLVVYLVARRFLDERLAFLAGFFFMSQIAFLMWLSLPIRQQVALFLFSLLVAALVSKLPPVRHKSLVLLLTLGVIVSHYSTSYALCAVLLVTYLLYKLISLANPNANVASILQHSIGKVLTGTFVITVFLATFMWYAQTTSTSSGIQNFLGQSLANIDNLLSDDVQNGQSSLTAQFNLFYQPESNQKVLEEYTQERLQTQQVTSDYKPSETGQLVLPYNVPADVARPVYFIGQLLQKGFKIILIVGVVVLVWRGLKTANSRTAPVTILGLGAFITLAITIVLPFASVDYDVTRSYQQLLVVLAIPTIIGMQVLLARFSKGIASVAMVLSIALLFVFNAPVVSQLVGGNVPTMLFNSFGSSYNHYYVARGEVLSGQWLLEAYQPGDLIRADRMGSQRLILNDDAYHKDARISQDLFPPLIQANDYVYAHQSNLNGVGTVSTHGMIIDYAFPTRELRSTKNQIYSNNNAVIFR
jgi:uncharacterized membrane protein